MNRTAQFLLVILSLSQNVFAQTIDIKNGDGSPLKMQYCFINHDYEITGVPAGGTFAGCGISMQNGQWYFNPVAATQGVTVFPYQCQFTYTVNNTSIAKDMLVWKPVMVNPPLQDSATCNGNFLLHATMLYAGDYDFRWFPAIYLTSADSVITPGNIQATQTFVLTAKDITSGCTGSDTIIITLNATPQLTVSNDTTVNAHSQLTLQASGADTYLWLPNKWLSNDTASNPLASPQTPVTYTVIGTNTDGCSDTATVSININQGLMVPNSFSPNGDGLNDVFKIQNFGYQVIKEFHIFSRWGQLVFQTMDGTKGWDGTFNGMPSDVGNYFYRIRIQSEDGSIRLYQGDLLLLR